MTKVSIWKIMIRIIVPWGWRIYFRAMSSMMIASIFSFLTFAASTGIILFMRAIRLSRKNAVKHGLYLILASFVCGIALMGWVISMG